MKPATFLGHTIGQRYQLLRAIGQGGMAMVYEARDLKFTNTRVAIKVLGRECRSVPALHRRFEQEIQVVSSLKSPHIVRVSDHGATDDGIPWLAMELLEGKDLARVLKESPGPLEWRRAVRIMIQLCDALAVAHEKGIVHRDIKPGNIFLSPRSSGDDFVTLLDLGIAKVVDPQKYRELNVEQTDPGHAPGTSTYISPEQVLGNELDARADFYSAGVVLYEMLTGTPPFVAPADAPRHAVRGLHVNATPVPPRTLNDAIPEDVENIVLACLAKAPEHRWESASALIAALKSTVGEAKPPPPPQPQPQPQPQLQPQQSSQHQPPSDGPGRWQQLIGRLRTRLQRKSSSSSVTSPAGGDSTSPSDPPRSPRDYARPLFIASTLFGGLAVSTSGLMLLITMYSMAQAAAPSVAGPPTSDSTPTDAAPAADATPADTVPANAAEATDAAPADAAPADTAPADTAPADSVPAGAAPIEDAVPADAAPPNAANAATDQAPTSSTEDHEVKPDKTGPPPPLSALKSFLRSYKVRPCRGQVFLGKARVKIQVSYDSDGNITKVSASGTAINVNQCVEEKLSKWSFPAYGKSGELTHTVDL